MVLNIKGNFWTVLDKEKVFGKAKQAINITVISVVIEKMVMDNIFG